MAWELSWVRLYWPVGAPYIESLTHCSRCRYCTSTPFHKFKRCLISHSEASASFLNCEATRNLRRILAKIRLRKKNKGQWLRRNSLLIALAFHILITESHNCIKKKKKRDYYEPARLLPYLHRAFESVPVSCSFIFIRHFFGFCKLLLIFFVVGPRPI